MNGLDFRLFRGSGGLDELADDWRELTVELERAGGVVASYAHLWEWYRAYVDALAGAPEAVSFGALYDRDRVVAIVPLELARIRVSAVPLDALSLPSHAHLPHGDIVVAPGWEARVDLATVVRRFGRAAHHGFDVAVLGSILADSCAARVLAAHPPTMAIGDAVNHSDALEVREYDAFLAGLSKNFRGALRKARNKLAALDGVEFTSTRDPAELGAAFAQFLAVEASGWKGGEGSGTAIALDPALRAFYTALVDRLGPAGRLEINLLARRGETLAAQFGIVAGDRLYLLKIGYDEAYRKQAPGNMLLERVLQKYAEDPAIAYVDLVSSAAWHTSWNPVQREVHTHHLFRRTPMGFLGWAALRSKERLRPGYRALRERLGKHDGDGGDGDH